jgi:transcriptional regulator with XRE-family HTH domain
MDEKLQCLLGEAAKAARLRLGLTQAQVAVKVGLRPGVYGRVERGHMMPSVPTLRRLCGTLGVSSDELLSLATPETMQAAGASAGAASAPQELSRIIYLLRGWPSDRLMLLRKLLETASSHLLT